MYVYVINKNGKPLMPCKITKAQHKSGVLEYIVLFSTKHLTEKKDKLKLMHKENAEALSIFFISERPYSKDIVPFTKKIYKEMLRYNVGIPETRSSQMRVAYRRGYVARDCIIPYYKDKFKEFYDSQFDFGKDYEFIEEIL